MNKYDMDLKRSEEIIVLHLETERNIAEKKERQREARRLNAEEKQ